MPSSLFREIIAGMTFVTCFMIFLIFAIASFRTYHLYKHNGWWKEVEPPLSITFYMIGASIFNGGLWFTRHLYNQDLNVDHLVVTFTLIITLGMIMKMIGGVSMIKQFSLQHWGHWPWVITLILSLLMGIYCYASYVSIWGYQSIW